MLRFARRRSRPIYFAGVLAAIIVSAFPVASPATRIVFRFFNLGETTAYTVQRNSSPLPTQATSPLGVLTQPVEAAKGDRIVLIRNEALSPPPPPVFTSATEQGPTCARLAWVPSGDPTVIGYVVSYGVLSVERGQVPNYQYSVEVGSLATHDLCELGAATYYFAIQSKNIAGQVSAYSSERSVEIVTAAVLISRFDARATIDEVRLSWEVEIDEDIRGFQLYRRVAGADERLLTDALLPVQTESYIDTDVQPGTSYTYVLAAMRPDGTMVRSAPTTATTPSYAFALEPNMPNPFRSSTRIPFTLAAASHVTVRVYDVKGALVATLFDGVLSQGSHEVGWGGHDMWGRTVATGTYFCALTADKAMRSHKMLLMR